MMEPWDAPTLLLLLVLSLDAHRNVMQTVSVLAGDVFVTQATKVLTVPNFLL